jgi:DNA repair exonuclease SbcCD ATPase subunit
MRCPECGDEFDPSEVFDQDQVKELVELVAPELRERRKEAAQEQRKLARMVDRAEERFDDLEEREERIRQREKELGLREPEVN